MDILAGMFAYLAGIGAVIAALAISFSVLVSQPNQAVQPQNQAQSATAMVVKPIQPNKAAPVEANSKRMHAEKQAAATNASAAAQPTPSAKDPHRTATASAARLRRLVQEERARRWAFQQDSRQDSSFESRFLGYAD